MQALVTGGLEWLVDAYGCRRDALRSTDLIAALFGRLVADLQLRPVDGPFWRTFPGGGLTGLVVLHESHFACHTFPEIGLAALNLYCCRSRHTWDWDRHLKAMLGAERVHVRVLMRGQGG